MLHRVEYEWVMKNAVEYSFETILFELFKIYAITNKICTYPVFFGSLPLLSNVDNLFIVIP